MTDTDGSPDGLSRRRVTGLVLGPVAMALLLLLPAPPGMEPAAWRTTAVAALMALWWVTEAVPIPVTALAPLLLFPLLQIRPFGDAAGPYANPIIFLFLGGFVLAEGMKRWNLHRRLALRVIRVAGTRPRRLIGGFMVAAAFLSMWISNTATAVMMLPIGISVIHLARDARDAAEAGDGEDPNFPVALMLGIAFACSIGGLGTLIGTPPNAFLAGYVGENFGIDLGFGRWMLVGLPLVAVGLPVAWLVLTRWAYPVRLGDIPGGRAAIGEELDQLGSPSRGEKLVGTVFLLTALAWITRPLLERWLPGLTDAGIAIAGAVALFLIPVHPRRGEFLMDWESARRLPWDVLILFGGGLSLAGAITHTGLADWVGEALAGMGLAALPVPVILLMVTTIIILATELMSNTAAAAAFLPILAVLAMGMGESPLLLAAPAAIAASCAFMMPVATPPNAIIYGSGFVTIPQMVRAGVLLNFLFVLLASFLGLALVAMIFG